MPHERKHALAIERYAVCHLPTALVHGFGSLNLQTDQATPLPQFIDCKDCRRRVQLEPFCRIDSKAHQLILGQVNTIATAILTDVSQDVRHLKSHAAVQGRLSTGR